MSWMVVSRTYTSLPFSLSVLALTVAGSFSATAGKFNPRFLEDTAGSTSMLTFPCTKLTMARSCLEHIAFL